MEFLFENHIIERTPAAVAKFFVDEKRYLSKAAIGSYLGEMSVLQLFFLNIAVCFRSKEFNMQVLDEYLKLHELTNN